MIQRIQTVYLLIVVALSCCSLFLPTAEFLTADGIQLSLKYMHVVGGATPYTDITTWVLFLLNVAVILVAGVTIFCYKNRPLQISLTAANMILFVGYYVLMGLLVYHYCDALSTDWHLRIPVVFPLVNIILSYLALRGIIKDEALVRSLDRLR